MLSLSTTRATWISPPPCHSFTISVTESTCLRDLTSMRRMFGKNSEIRQVIPVGAEHDFSRKEQGRVGAELHVRYSRKQSGLGCDRTRAQGRSTSPSSTTIAAWVTPRIEFRRRAPEERACALVDVHRFFRPGAGSP
jgi:hypothetical protein